jgi:hypothetical protein
MRYLYVILSRDARSKTVSARDSYSIGVALSGAGVVERMGFRPPQATPFQRRW